MRSYLKLTCEYELLPLSNAKVGVAKVDLYGKLLKSSQKIIDTITLKMADHGRSDFYVVFTVDLCTFQLKQT